MKLSTKISAAAVGLLLLLSQIFSLWNLTVSRRELLDTIVLDEADRLKKSLKNLENEYVRAEGYLPDEPSVCFWAVQTFRRDGSDHSVLYYQSEELFNNTPYEFDVEYPGAVPLNTNGIDGKQLKMDRDHIFLEEIHQKKLLILYETSTHGFRIVHYRDITSVYEKSGRLFLHGMFLALFLALVLTVVLTLIIRRILTPFYRLRDAANRIASGDYSRRVEDPGKDEVGEVAQSFNCMAESVEQHVRELAGLNEKQRQLLGALAHELKTPMTGIQGYAELLQRVELPPKKQADALAYIRDECRRLSRLSVKMLQLTELSQEEQIEKRQLSVKALCAHAEEIVHCRLLEEQIFLEVQAEDGLQIEGDEDLLLSFLTNLIDNAAKASRPGSTIWLTGTSEGLFVRDEGEGIPETERLRVTEPFYMVDKSRSRAQGGAGLGLALCAQIARLHEGSLKIESVPGEGSTVGLVWECPH